MVHFQTIVVGHFADLRLHPHKGRSVTHVHDDAMVQDDRSREAAIGAGLPWFRGGLVEHSGGGLPDHGGPPLAVGDGPRPGDARLEPARAHVGFHHAGRGSALSHQHRGSQPVRPRRARLPRGAGHLPAGAPRAGGIEVPREDPPVRARGDGRRVGHPHLVAGRLLPRRRGHAGPREPPRHRHGAHGRRPGHVRGRPLGQGARARQRRRRRLVRVRHVERVRAHADPRRPGRPRRAPPGGDDARRPAGWTLDLGLVGPGSEGRRNVTVTSEDFGAADRRVISARRG